MNIHHGAGTREFGLMVDYGMKPMDAILSATREGARLPGIERETGSLGPGLAADIVAVGGNPLEDIRVLENVNFVMKAVTIHMKVDQ